jgi:hypothetical protein
MKETARNALNGVFVTPLARVWVYMCSKKWWKAGKFEKVEEELR